MSTSALPGKTKTSDMCMNKNFNKFYIFGPVAPNNQSITLIDCHAALFNQMTFMNVNEFKQ